MSRQVQAQALCFQTVTNTRVGNYPSSVAVADFNGDGRPDVVTANNAVNGSVSVLLRTGATTFAAKTDFSMTGEPWAVAVGDFNGDGKTDVVTTNSDGSNISVRLGTGTGSFGNKADFTVGTRPMSVAVGDFNGDGKTDLVTGNYNSNNISVLLGTGNGTFEPKADVTVGAAPNSVAVGDFNGDGKTDLAVADFQNNGSNISVLLGTGNGTFESKTDFPAGNASGSVAVGDFNGDGKTDLVTANYWGSSVSVLLGTGTGSFGAKTDFPVGNTPNSVAVGDFNGDGKTDLVTANFSVNNVSVLLGTGTGTFGSKTDFPVGGGPNSVAVGDFNSDGKTDLTTANFNTDNASVRLNCTVFPPNLVTSATPNPVCAGTTTTLSVTASGGTAPYSYTWAAPAGIILSATSTSAVSASVGTAVSGLQTFTLTAASSGGSPTSTSLVTVSVNAVPTNASLTSGVLTCANTSVTLTALATNGSTYTFSAGAIQIGTSNQAVVNQPGTYSVIVANASGCTASASSTVVNEMTSTLTWTGQTSTNWNVANNWCPARVPLTTDDVVIPSSPTNQPVLSTTAVAKSVEVQSGSSLSITAEGSLTINGSKSIGGTITGFYNNGSVNNNGQLVLGNTASVGQFGLVNRATFNNNPGSSISIDRANFVGLLNQDGTFTNSAQITIGAIVSGGSIGLNNYGPFINNSGGSIAIDHTSSSGLFNYNNFTNLGQLMIGANASVGDYGISNRATFTNNFGGSIAIDRVNLTGLLNQTGTFTNSAQLTIGAIASVGSEGVRNLATFNNSGCGALLNVVANITNFSSFSNSGTIIKNASGNSSISTNTGIIQNLNGGTFSVSGTNTGVVTTSSGVLWTGCTSTDWNTPANWSAGRVPLTTDDVVIPSSPTNQPVLSMTVVTNSVEVQSGVSLSITAGGSLSINGSKSINGTTMAFCNNGTVSNSGQLAIGTIASVGYYGLSNYSTFTNNPGGIISIDRAFSSGLYNYSGTFTNSGQLTIGAIASGGQYGLENRSTFTNNPQGHITIDRATHSSLYNYSGTFTNSGQLAIGANASVGSFGLWNWTTFNNNPGGSIAIDRASVSGLYNYSGTFTNSAQITIGAITPVGVLGIWNVATFNNSGCGALLNIVANAVIENKESFSNSGTIIENAIGNSSISTNTGIIQNLNGGVFTVGTGNQPLSVSATNPTTCTPSNGSLTISGLHANTTYALSYTVDGNATTVSPAPVSDANGQFVVGNRGAGVYSLALSGSCVAQTLPLSATLTMPASPTLITQPTAGTAVCVGSPVSTSVNVSGTGPFTYQWYKDGLDVNGQTSATLSLTNVQTVAGGSYSVVVTGACNSVTSTAFSLTVNSSPVASLSNNGPLTCDQPMAILTASGGSTYQFSAGATHYDPANNTATVSLGGVYSVTVLNAAGCSAVASTTVTVDQTPPVASIQPASATLTCTTPVVNLSAVGVGTYRWSNEGTTSAISVTSANTYSVTVTSANGCSGTATINVSADQTSPSLLLNPQSTTLTCTTTAVSLTAVGMGTYRWSNGATTSAISVSMADTYSVTLTGANGCSSTAIASVSIDQTPPSISIAPSIGTPSGVTLTCTTPVVNLSAVGVGTYRWSTGATTSAISVTSANTYSVTVTSANGCSGTATINVSADQTSPSLLLNPQSATLTCTNTAVSLTAVGMGTYRWSTGATSAVISATSAGTYSITLTGANGCSATATTSISLNNTPPSVSIAPTNATLTCATTAVSLSAVGVGTYRWSTGATTQVISTTLAGAYSVTLTGANGCSSTATVSISQDQTPPSLTISPSIGTLTCTNPVVSLSAVGAGTYRWSNGGTTSVISTTLSGAYSVTLTGANGCSSTASANVSVDQTPPSLTIVSSSATLSCATTSVSLSAVGVGTYRWSTGATTSAISVTSANTYSVTLTGANGCSRTASVSVGYQNCAPTVANVLPPQSTTLGNAFSYTLPANTFTDAETPNSLTLSVVGLPAGLSFVAPNLITGVPSTTVGSPFSVTVVATDPGGLSVSTTFGLSVQSRSFAISGITMLDCNHVSYYERRINFTVSFEQTNGQPISLSVVNETLSITINEPYQLTVFTDNPVIVFKASQQGTPGEASFSYNWLSYCSNGNPRVENPIPPQSATVGQAFSYPIPTTTFTDAETPSSLSLSVLGLPAGLSLVSPNVITGVVSASASTFYSVTVIATDASGGRVSTLWPLSVENGSGCGSMYSVKGGAWSDASVWSCGRVPLVTDVVTLNHTVSLPASYVGQAQRVIYTSTGRLQFAISSRLRLGTN
ncbi:FG-GAP-like repeat-containing protein [Spirosoma daeguense]